MSGFENMNKRENFYEAISHVIKTEGIADLFQQEKFAEGAGRFLEKLGIEPVYKNVNENDFVEDRAKLQQESGLIICNHPGTIEITAIMKALQRRDVVYVVSPSAMKFFVEIFGESAEKFLVPVKHTNPEGEDQVSRELLPKLEEHIGAGGVAVLFPSGGNDRDGQPLEFEGAFRHLINKSDDQKMVYTFHATMENPTKDDLKDERKRLAIAALQARIPGRPNVNQLKKRKLLMHEKFTTAEEWKSVMEDQTRDKRQKNQLLTAHYKEIFGLDHGV